VAPPSPLQEKAGVVSFVYAPFKGNERLGTEGATLSKMIVSEAVEEVFPAVSLYWTVTVLVPCVFTSVQLALVAYVNQGA
jgi:hypothetical protein